HLCFGRAVIRLDPVSIRIDDEGGVIVGAVDRARTGRTVVLPARAPRCRVKGVDRLGARCHEADVQARLLVGRNRTLDGDNPESDVIAPIPVAQHCSPRPQAPVSERCQRRVVKALASFEVPDPDREMSDHSRSPLVKLTHYRNAYAVRASTCPSFSTYSCTSKLGAGIDFAMESYGLADRLGGAVTLPCHGPYTRPKAEAVPRETQGGGPNEPRRDRARAHARGRAVRAGRIVGPGA